MNYHNILTVLILITGILMLAQPVLAVEQVQQEIIYQTAFSTDPHWTTNNPRSDYWDPSKGAYHYGIEPGTGNYAYVTVDYSRGPFTLEYDVTPIRTDEGATFRLGFGTKEMDRTKGTVALTEFTNSKYGKVMWLRAVTPGNKLFFINSASSCIDCTIPEYTGPTVRYQDNRTYHVVLQYDDLRQTLSMRVTDKVTAEEIWGYFIKTYESLHDMNRVFIGSIGDYSDSGRYAEGYIDNVRLYTEQTVTVTPTEVVTTPATIPATKTTRTTARPMTTAPTPTPTSPVPPAIPFAALVIAGSALAIMKIRKKQ